MLFWEPEFLAWQGNVEILEAEGLSMPVFLKDGQALSPLKAPFGGIFPPESMSPPSIKALLSVVEAWLRKYRIPRFQLVLPPDIYLGEKAPILHKSLTEAGYRPLWQDLNFHLDARIPFAAGLRPSERWKLNRSLREGFGVVKETGFPWDEIFPILENSRSRKGYALSMDLEELARTTARFPEQYRLWTVRREGEALAMGLCIRVSPEMEYLFYTADTLTWRRLSPVVLLHKGIHEAAGMEGRHILDLGTASLRGVINPGVATFKRNLGAQAGLKVSYVRYPG